MLRRFHSALALAALIAATTSVAANAQVFYLYPEAPPVGDTQPATGGGLGIAGDQLRFLGFGRFNVSPGMDLGVEVVLDRLSGSGPGGNSSWRFGLGGDVKRAIIPSDRPLPFDLAVQAGFGFQTGGNLTSFDLPVGAVASRPVRMDNGREFVPYAALYLVVRRVSFDLPAPFDVSDTDLDIDLRLGSSFQLFDSGDAFVTLNISSDVMVFFGFNAGI